MRSLEIAQKLAKLQMVEDAQKAYMLVLKENNHQDPLVDFEAAAYILLTGGDAKVAFTQLVRLYNNGEFQEEVLDLMTKQFYIPEIANRQKQYDLNVKKLSNYPYLFRKDFVNFVDLGIKFFPFGNGFVPFYPAENRFGEYVDFNRKLIERHFFRDLEKPIFEEDLYSQYQLEYLVDNVRKSEWVAKDNHIYMHYSNWEVFCAYLQVLNFNPLLQDEKFVFLIEEEATLYPINFSVRFGIDYSSYSIKPIDVSEVTKLIWHAQLSAHNGGDFFNEVFDNHPNLLLLHSLMMDKLGEALKGLKTNIKQKPINLDLEIDGKRHKIPFGNYLRFKKNVNEKDVLVAYMLALARGYKSLDEGARIVPAVFLQPHFPNIFYSIIHDKQDRVRLHSDALEQIKNQPIFKQFKYIKTFIPVRRPTTSYAATLKFKLDPSLQEENVVLDNVIANVVLSCSFRVDKSERLYQDSRLVRFEDGKLNPKATFAALSSFLDIPYTETMTYCSYYGEKDQETFKGNTIGFDPASVYKTYDEFAGKNERYLIEYLMKDAYEKCGYGFNYYDGAEPQGEQLVHIVENLDKLYSGIRDTCQKTGQNTPELEGNAEKIELATKAYLEPIVEMNRNITSVFKQGIILYKQ